MPEIFRFTQLREPTGINVEEERQKHIQFFKYLEGLEGWEINKSFKVSFEEGIKSTSNYVDANKDFQNRTKIPTAIITGNWGSPLNEAHKGFFELSYLLSQYNSDKKENQNKDLFSQISEKLKNIDNNNIKESIKQFAIYFEDLLVLYFHSGKHPSYLRLLIKLRRWHFVFNKFSLDEIKESFDKTPESLIQIEVNNPLHFLINAKILLPKHLFAKPPKKKPKKKPNKKPDNPTDVEKEKPDEVSTSVTNPVGKKITIKTIKRK